LGIVHRDIKPSNIIIRPNGESAYLVDFGIALTTEDTKKLTKSGFAIGTPGYMSPEQSAGEVVDNRTDIYSLGVTLYEALAGEPIPVGQYIELSATNEAVPPEIDNIIHDCLLPKNQRLDSAKTFSARLAGALRPLKPLSEILAHGKLYELASALEDLSAETFSQLPAGQIALILAKVADITSSNDTKLETASVALLIALLKCGILLQKDDYREIARPAIDWGFVRTSSRGNLGYDAVRRALAEASFLARASAHEVLQEEFVAFLKKTKLDKQQEWYLHSVRELLNTLLANPSCTGGAGELANSLREINRIQRSRSA
jgi:serine/threonine protein kinase